MKVLKKILAVSGVLSMLFYMVACENQENTGSSFPITAEDSIYETSSEISNEITQPDKTDTENSNVDNKTQEGSKPSSYSDKNSGKASSLTKPTTTTSSKKNETNKPNVSNSSQLSSSTKPNINVVTNSNKKLTPISENDYYGWKILLKSGTDAERKAYKLFVEKIGNFETEISFNFNITREEVTRAYNIYHADYPEHFWRGTSYVMNYSGNSVKKFVLENNPYDANASKIKIAKEKTDAAANKILSKLNGSMSDFEKEVIIHNEIINMTRYKNGTNGHRISGVFVDGEAVCEGYALAFQYLMRKAGVECITVVGQFNGDNHMWNMVKIGGDYYHIDVTADDPLIAGGSQMILFDYFNLSTDKIKNTHSISGNEYAVPVASKENYEFFNKNSLVVRNLSVKNVANIYVFAVKNGYDRAYARLEGITQKQMATFIANNIRDIVKETNKILGSNVVNASGKISYSGNPQRNTFHVEID